MKIIITINILFFWLVVFEVYCQKTDKLSRQPLFHEPFNDNSNEWMGIGVNDQQGSAKIIENKYCEIIAPRDSSMIIANEQIIDGNRDFELSCGIRMLPKQSKAINSAISISWGCSFDNMYQYSFSLTPSKYFMVRKYTDIIEDIVAPRLVSAIDPKELNVVTVKKKGDFYSIYINRNLIATAPFSELFGGGIILTVESGLTVLVDHINIDYLIAETDNQSAPSLILDPPLSGTDKVETTTTDFLLSGLTINEGGINKLSINGSSVETVNGHFRHVVPLITGNNMFKLEVVSPKGGKLIKYIEIIRSEPPEKLLVSQKRLALVIGNSKYKYSAELKNPVKDADDMARLLQSMRFEVMHYTDLSYQAFNDALKCFGAKINEFDVTLVFYAGHGIQVEGKNYMLPVDAQLKNKTDIAFEAIDVEKITNILAETDDSKLNLLILDACRNNPFRSWSRGGAEGLVGIHPPSGVLVAFSTSPGSYASDGIGQNGLYTGELMRQLNISQRVEDIFINTRLEVERKSNGTQSPWELARLRGKYFLK